MNALDRDTSRFDILQYVTIRSKIFSIKLLTASSQDHGAAQSPDRYQLSSSYVDSIPTVKKAEKNVSNGQLYILDPQTNQWIEAPGAASAALPILTVGRPGSIQHLKLIGEETRDGMLLYHLTGTDLMYYKIIDNGRIEVPLHVDHWVEK